MGNLDTEDPIQGEPTETQLWLFERLISGIKVEYRQTGTDTAETWVRFIDIDKHSHECLYSSIVNSIKFQITYNSVCELNSQTYNMVKGYKAWKDRNKKDIAEYNRLKKKLGL